MYKLSWSLEQPSVVYPPLRRQLKQTLLEIVRSQPILATVIACDSFDNTCSHFVLVTRLLSGVTEDLHLSSLSETMPSWCVVALRAWGLKWRQFT